MHHYWTKKEERNTWRLPSLLVEYVDELQGEAGWYWCCCFPGCLPENEWTGPFDSEEEALQDARSTFDVDEEEEEEEEEAIDA